MTTESPSPNDDITARDEPLEPWMLDLAREAVDELDADVEVPRAMMWARIDRQRRAVQEQGPRVATAATHDTASTPAAMAGIAPRLGTWRRMTAIAAVLVGGVAIGRYVIPSPEAARLAAADSLRNASTGSVAADPARRSDPSHVAMQEHLVRTVALLAAVQKTATPATQPDLGPWAGELLATTRLLLDQPQLRDDRTRRLLQDLELVLVQIVQARSSAPETQRAPQETMRETDLLTRVRAVVSASGAHDALTSGDD